MRDVAMFYHFQLKTNSKAESAIEQLHAWGIKGKNIVRLGTGFHDNSFNCFIDYMTNQKLYTIVIALFRYLTSLVASQKFHLFHQSNLEIILFNFIIGNFPAILLKPILRELKLFSVGYIKKNTRILT